MHNTTTRRDLLKVAPVAAVAVSIPTTAGATGCAHNPTWEEAKADFLAATERFNAAVDASIRADSEEQDWCQANPAPRRQINFAEGGWCIDNECAHIELKPRELKLVLSDSNLFHAPESMKSTPEYATFLAEIEAWRARKQAEANARGWEAVTLEWDQAANAQIAAWERLVTCPVYAAEHIAQKVELARGDLCSDEPEFNLLMTSLSADLRRVLGEA